MCLFLTHFYTSVILNLQCFYYIIFVWTWDKYKVLSKVFSCQISKWYLCIGSHKARWKLIYGLVKHGEDEKIAVIVANVTPLVTCQCQPISLNKIVLILYYCIFHKSNQCGLNLHGPLVNEIAEFPSLVFNSIQSHSLHMVGISPWLLSLLQ